MTTTSWSQRWQAVARAGATRESRDALFLLAVIGWICIPHMQHLPVWCSVWCAATLVWRLCLVLTGARLPGRITLVVMLMLCVAGNLYSYHSLLGREAGVTFLLSLLTLKTLETRTPRDVYVLFFLGFFALVCQFLYSQSLPSTAAMLAGAVGLLAILVNTNMPLGVPPLLSILRRAATLALLGAPVMLALFLFFPRIAPLWGMPGTNARSISGLSSSVQIGNLANLALDSSIAMRVRFVGEPPAQQELYFRGPVLSHFDGHMWTTWQSQRTAPERTSRIEVMGEATYYEITLEPSQQPWLLLLDASTDAPQLPGGYRAHMQNDLQWLTNRPVTGVLRYQARSHTHFHHGPLHWDSSLQDALGLPSGFNPRTVAWAAALRKQPAYVHADNATLVRAGLNQLRTGGYTYTLEPGPYGTHTADEFWFDRKQGFCEHIATSFVVLMRALQVPARLVTGYQGGERNPLDNIWTVRQSDAHAWTEVWLDGEGWVRVDPTAILAPQRTAGLARLVPPGNILAQALQVVSPDFLSNIRLALDAINGSWNDWVLNYTQTNQLNLLRNMGFAEPDWIDLIRVLIAVIALGLVAFLVLSYQRRHQRNAWLRLLERARLKLAGVGVPSEPHATPRALALAVQQRYSATDDSLRALTDWLLRMEQWRYAAPGGTGAGAGSGAGGGNTVPLGTLRQEFRQLRWPPKLPPETQAP